MRFDRIPGHNPQGEYWQGYRWSAWYQLEKICRARAKPEWHDDRDGEEFLTPGALYRFRVYGRRGLLYLGETGRSPKARLRAHLRGYNIASGAKPMDYPRRLLEVHRRLAEVAEQFGSTRRLEVSWTSVGALSRGDRKGVEAELIAAYRGVVGRNPDAQWGGDEEDEEDL